MSGVIEQFKKYIAELGEFLAPDSSQEKNPKFLLIEQKRLNTLVDTLKVAIIGKNQGEYVEASKIDDVKIKAKHFINENICSVTESIFSYCADVLTYRHKMLTSVLNAPQYCKTVPGFAMKVGPHFCEDELKIMEVCFQTSIPDLAEYFSKSTYQEIILKLKESGIFLEPDINRKLRAVQKKQELLFLDITCAAKPPAKKRLPAGDFSDLLTPELLEYYSERHRKYGFAPTPPHSAHGPSSQKIAVAPRKAQSARAASRYADGDNAKESSEREKPFVPLLHLSKMRQTSSSDAESADVEVLSGQLEQCSLKSKQPTKDKRHRRKQKTNHAH
tara:strand:- start:15292 stop:16284 length:993 start_codon:yes stop_codon:yes gene_type:complete